MSKKNTLQVKRRRRREGKTDYIMRYNLLKGRTPRLIVRILNKMITVQIAEYKPKGDSVLVSTNSLELKKHGWQPKRNIPTAYLTGVLIGKRATAKGIKKAILDIGLQRPHKKGKIFAVLKGALDAGLEINHDKKSLPSEERITGKHIEEYKNIKLNFEEIKAKVMSLRNQPQTIERGEKK